jgi:hypothetical protein
LGNRGVGVRAERGATGGGFSLSLSLCPPRLKLQIEAGMGKGEGEGEGMGKGEGDSMVFLTPELLRLYSAGCAGRKDCYEGNLLAKGKIGDWNFKQFLVFFRPSRSLAHSGTKWPSNQ